MSNEQHREFAIRALQNLKGDNLYRARHAFKGMTPEQMQQQYGQSGSTRAEILAEYEAYEAKVDATIEWVRGAA